MSDSRKMLVGVDIGGTKVAAGLVADGGEITFKTRVQMNTGADAATAFACVTSAIESVFALLRASRDSLAGTGICSPGPLDPRTGVVLNPPNIPCWRNFELADEVQRTFAVLARVDNDANAAGLAEAISGAGVGYESVFYVTLGTGIGTGIVFDGHIYYGRTGGAAEGGHMSIDYNGPTCGCGKRGCIEALCSGPAIALRARTKIGAQGSGSSKIVDLAGGVDQIRAEHVGAAYHHGDAIAEQVLRETADLLTVWLGNIVDLIEPDVIIIGGGVSELMSNFYGYISENLPHWSINQRCREIPLVQAKYGPDAGIVGAAALIRSAANSAAVATHSL